MAGKTWWQRVIVSAFRGIRAGVAALLKPARKTDAPITLIQDQERNQEKEELIEDSPKVNSNPAPKAEPVVNPPAEIAEETPALEPATAPEPETAAHEVAGAEPEAPEPPVTVEPAATTEAPAELEISAQNELPKEATEGSPKREPGVEIEPTVAAPQGQPNPDQAPDTAGPAEEGAPKQPAVPQLPPQAASAAPQVPDPEMPEIEEVEEAFEAEDAEEIIETEAPAEEPAAQSEPIEYTEEAELDEAAEPEFTHEPSDDQPTLPGQAIEETIVTPEIETEATAQQPDLEAEPDVLIEEESGEAELPEEATTDEEVLVEEVSVEETLTEEAPVEETKPDEQPLTEAPADEATAPESAESKPEPSEVQPEIEAASEPTATTAEPERPVDPQLPAKPASAAPQVPHEPIKREQGPDTSPVNVLVSQVYEGPFDLLLDLIRKQDIDIYDIPIAKITAQFLAYVDKLKASDMDVAGEFIYTASLLIHIKSKMLLPREPKGPGEEAEDPRRELVERLLEHERFKNAAQMLQQKQMLEAATWTNPGMREFRDDAGTEPEIAADTVDLVRVFREILDRARNRPVLNLQEDSVTVGQMIQFLGRRLTMEDKPVALRRLLAHTKSERALIAMFLALLELVRLQAILLRQDHHFTEIFIKKNTGFDAVINEGMARDDWQ